MTMTATNRAARRKVAKYCAERDAVLRSLDVDRLEAHCRKWAVPMPDDWIGEAPMILMHKSRLAINAFTEAEKAASREWLIAHGCSPFFKGIGQ